MQREVVSKIWCIWVSGKKSRLQFARELRGCEAALGLILMFELRRRCILLHKLGKIFAIWFRWGCTALRWRFQLFGNPALCQIFVQWDEEIIIVIYYENIFPHKPINPIERMEQNKVKNATSAVLSSVLWRFLGCIFTWSGGDWVLSGDVHSRHSTFPGVN